MATVYFTNNADSGDGSLRNAIAAAADGDVITYDDGCFDGSDEIVIILSSYLAIMKDVVLDARGKRIVLDGQFTSSCLWATADLQLRKVDLINGYSNSYYSGGLYSRGGAVTLDACRIHGCFCKVYGSALYAYSGSVVLNDCLITGCCTGTVQDLSASVRAGIGSSVAINRCTIVGDAQRALSASPDGLIVVADSLVQGVYNVSSAVSVTPSTCGFAAPCPDVIDPESWDNTLWESWDFRLTSESPYLSGAETVEEGDVDVLGHARKVNGAIGAYEGSWLVGSQTIATNTTVDYCDFKSGNTVTFSGEDRFLSVKEAAYIDGATFTAETRSYLATPTGTNYGDSTFTSVVPCTYGANITSFTADRQDSNITITWEETVGKSFLIETLESGGWTTLEGYTTSPYTFQHLSGTTFRTFDGVSFAIRATVPALTMDYELAARQRIGYLVTKTAVGYLN